MPVGAAEVWISGRIAWQIERHFGRYGDIRAAGDDDDGGARLFVTPYANARQLIAWTLGLGENARILGPPELVAELRERVALLVDRHSGDPQVAEALTPMEPAAAAAATNLVAAVARRQSDPGGSCHHRNLAA